MLPTWTIGLNVLPDNITQATNAPIVKSVEAIRKTPKKIIGLEGFDIKITKQELIK